MQNCSADAIRGRGAGGRGGARVDRGSPRVLGREDGRKEDAPRQGRASKSRSNPRYGHRPRRRSPTGTRGRFSQPSQARTAWVGGASSTATVGDPAWASPDGPLRRRSTERSDRTIPARLGDARPARPRLLGISRRGPPPSASPSLDPARFSGYRMHPRSPRVVEREEGARFPSVARAHRDLADEPGPPHRRDEGPILREDEAVEQVDPDEDMREGEGESVHFTLVGIPRPELPLAPSRRPRGSEGVPGNYPADQPGAALPGQTERESMPDSHSSTPTKMNCPPLDRRAESG